MNRLAGASSPYLRQHADNPVDWYEWGDEAWERARAEDKPVFLSVGYASCHWCHVMAHESFEDDATAALLNEHFVPIKVDREERPDVDAVYMSAVQALTGRGGWPMSVFCAPDGRPFHGGTYWPPESRHGMPGFPDVLRSIAQLWEGERDRVDRAGDALLDHLRRLTSARAEAAGAVDLDALVRDAARGAVAAWDRELGGFGHAPKFPQAMTIDFLLAHHVRTGDADALAAAAATLRAMSQGGIYDHVAGGFARYSVDEVWLVPHFEKMLYDNALLLRAYVHAWQVTGDARFRRIAIETSDYLLREMRSPEGAFWSATDADSEGVEGRFFVWSDEEFREVVSATGEDPQPWVEFFGVTPGGNFADPHHPELPAANVLSEPVARDESDAAFDERFRRVRGALYERREQRVHPGLDDKVLTSWNALALGALAEAGAVLGVPAYVAAASRCARFLRDRLVVDGALQHVWTSAHGASVGAFAEDVAFLAQALLVLYEADHDVAWVAWARRLVDDADARFADGETGTYFTSASDAEALVARPKETWDGATPSPSSALADARLRLHGLTGEHAHAAAAERTIAAFAGDARRAPTGFGQILTAAERLLGSPLELAIVGSPAEASPLVSVYRERWRPGAVLAVGGPDDATAVPLLADRPRLDGHPTAYVCRNFACERPVTGPEELRGLLDGG